jgi:hypothetical protein
VLGEVTWLIAPFAFGTVFFALAASDRAVTHAILGQGPLRFLGRVSYSRTSTTCWCSRSGTPSCPARMASLPLYLARLLDRLDLVALRRIAVPENQDQTSIASHCERGDDRETLESATPRGRASNARRP